MSFRLRGLYAITPDCADPHGLHAEVGAALKGGAAIIQYRNKALDAHLGAHQACELFKLSKQAGVPFIVNDDVELALRIGADGVHLGKTDGSIAAARARLGAGKIIGASCYNDLDLARRAEQEGADYVAFGSFFASPTKPHAVPAPLGLLGEAKRSLALPVCAIGGITLENARQLIGAGADMVAVISALFNAADVVSAAQQFSQLFTSGHVRSKQNAV
jgi:thiamine-phosphate pyrophosphorylase